METSYCVHCGKTYEDKNSHGSFSRRFGWPEGKPVWVATCNCREAFEAEARAQEFQADGEARVQLAFDYLGFGGSQNLPAPIRDIGAPWNDTKTGFASGRNLILTGAVGTGKTTVLKNIVKDLVLNYTPVRGGYVPQLMSVLKNMSDLTEVMASIEYGKVLVLDDLDKMLGTVYEIERLSSMVNLCIQKNKPVLVTTNLTFVELRRMLCSNKYNVPENWVDSFLSRLKHNAQVVTFVGSDLRSVGSVSAVEI